MINYVTGFMFSSDKKNVALITKINPAWQKGLINGIGGKIELGETPEQAMSREFHEETGVHTLPDQWTCYCIINRPDKYSVNFLVSINDNVFSTRSVEKEVVGVYEVSNPPHNIIDNLCWLIPMSIDKNLIFSRPIILEENREIN